MTADCGSKRCTSCGIPKLLKRFHKHKDTADGLMHICIACHTSEPKEKVSKRPDIDLAALLRGWRKPK